MTEDERDIVAAMADGAKDSLEIIANFLEDGGDISSEHAEFIKDVAVRTQDIAAKVIVKKLERTVKHGKV